MKPAQLTQMIAAPMASIFLILSLCAFSYSPHRSAGERVIPLYLYRFYETDCLGRPVVFHLHEDGTVEVNSENLTHGWARAHVREILKNRAEPAVYFFADPAVQIADVEATLDSLRTDTPDIEILFFSTGARQAYWNPHNHSVCIGPVNSKTLPDPAIVLSSGLRLERP